MGLIEAEWALWSERAEARDDYTVLACSDGRLTAAHFRTIITRFSPGTPDDDGALPRVTLSALDFAQQPHIGLAIQTVSADVDGVGRKIAPTSFFCFPYRALRDQPVSYLALYQALHGIRLGEEGSKPIRIDVPPLDPIAIAADLETLGAETARTAASLFLTKSRRICVTQAEHTTLDERLRFLDVVAALLPYGFRAKLTATTWANSATRHRLRLSFARNATERIPLPWQGPAPRLAGHTMEGDHFEQLGVVLTRHRPADVIAELAEDGDARTLDNPSSAVDALRHLDHELGLLAQITSGSASLDGLRAFLSGPPDEVRHAYPDHCGKAVYQLILAAQGKDVELIARWLPYFAVGSLERWLEPLQTMANQLLWSQEDVRLWPLLRVTIDAGLGDPFLSGLVVGPQKAGSLENGISAAAGLLVGVIDPGHDMLAAFPETSRRLASNFPLACELLAELAAPLHAGLLETGLEWVSQLVPGDVYKPFLPVLGRSHLQVTGAQIGALAKRGNACVKALLDAACQQGRTQLVNEGLVDWIIKRKGFLLGEEAYWSGQLSRLEPEDPAMRAILDVLLLMTSSRPTALMQIGREHWEHYLGCFALAWNRIAHDKARMTLQLSSYLREQRWEHPGRADEVMELLERLELLGEPSVRNGFRQSLAEAADLTSDPRAYAFVADLRAQAAAKTALMPQQALAAHSNLSTLAAEDTATVDRVVQELVSYCQNGTPAQHAISWLASRQPFRDAGIALRVVTDLQTALATKITPQTGTEWTLLLIEKLCSGAFGPNLAYDFRERQLLEIVENLRWRVDRLESIAKGSPTALETSPHRFQLVGLLNRAGALFSEPKKRRWRKGDDSEPGDKQPSRLLVPGFRKQDRDS